MEFPDDQITELKNMFPETTRYDENSCTYFLIPKMCLPDGCTPKQVDVLLCPTGREGYSSRLFFSDRVDTQKQLNWNSLGTRIIERNWNAFSWRISGANLRLAQTNITFESTSEMRIEIRLTRTLLEQMKQDLSRPHDFAYERIGFAYAKLGKISEQEHLILLSEYFPVADEHYIYAPEVGAKINGDAIRTAMQHVLASKTTVFHVHSHHPCLAKKLMFSKVDMADFSRLIPSFQAVGPTTPHLIPYIDIGMDVHCIKGQPPRMAGQIILSMPKEPCMFCLGFLTEENLAKEASQYGGAGPKPQVIWPNGVLASTAIGIAVDLLTDWSQSLRRMVYLSYDGNELTLKPHPRLPFIKNTVCPHYPSDMLGDPVPKRL